MFRSWAEGVDAAKALDRYKAEWTCRVGNSSPVTFTKNRPAGGFVVEEGKKVIDGNEVGYSEVRHANDANEPIYCKADWDSILEPSSVDIHKTVDGSGPGAETNYGFEYACVIPDSAKTPASRTPSGQESSTLALFNSAYPGIEQKGTGAVRNNGTLSFEGLVEGSECTFKETPATFDGHRHEVSWDGSNFASASENPKTTVVGSGGGSVTLQAVNKFIPDPPIVNLMQTVEGSAAESVIPSNTAKEFTYDLDCKKPNSGVSVDISNNQQGVLVGTARSEVSNANSQCALTVIDPEVPANVERTNLVVKVGENQTTVSPSGSNNQFTIPLKSGPGAVTDVSVVSNYEFKKSALKVNVEPQWPDSATDDDKSVAIPVNYECTPPQPGINGTVNVSPEKAANDNVEPAVISDVPLNASCTLKIEVPNEYKRFELSDAPIEVQHYDANNVLTSLGRLDPVNGITFPANDDVAPRLFDHVVIRPTFKRRTVGVRVVNFKNPEASTLLTGNLSDGKRFENAFECDGETFPSDNTQGITTFADAGDASNSGLWGTSAPTGGTVVQLPAGAKCTYKLQGSALDAHTHIDVTNGDRKPYSQVGAWGAEEQKPSTNPTSLLDEESNVDDSKKSPTLTFRVPVAKPANNEPVMTIASETFFKTAVADVKFVKKAEGAASDGQEFRFNLKCADQTDKEFVVESGKSHLLKNMKIGRTCSIEEVVPDPSPIPFVKTGESGTLVSLTPEAATASTPPKWDIEVLPVEDASDTNTSGSKWSVEAINTIPGIELEKKIKGGLISPMTQAVSGSVLLPLGAEKMTVTYTAVNKSGKALNSLSLKDPSLSGLTVVDSGGSEYSIGQDGAIPDGVCSWNSTQTPMNLEGNQSVGCSFDVKIPDSGNYYHYEGDSAVVTATVADSPRDLKDSVSDSAATDAIRLSASVSGMLPQAGVPTLVLVLLLGLGTLIFGLWRYLRREEEDDQLQAA
ncbi:hypothetical protein CPHO_03265 [Corynebacterium phocae]|uniref:DUF5979 domain-containing protein n=2 Tax=Corynebacterium phocae TaxID=161895 RepID=A0A1L7D218_9CORY|nr:hypothetical protein CPHO_03265 [Corynebacterium phocae]